jgi:Apea-like HEPN
VPQRFPELNNCLGRFAKEALLFFGKTREPPVFGEAPYGMSSKWRRDPEEDEYEYRLVEQPEVVWLRDDLGDLLADWDELKELPSYSTLLALLNRQPELLHRITVASCGAYRSIGWPDREVPAFLEDELLVPLIMEGRSFNLTDRAIKKRCLVIDKSLIRFRLKHHAFVPLQNFISRTDFIQLDEDLVVRRLSDDEITRAFTFGVVKANHTPAGETFLSDAYQWALTWQSITTIEDEDFQTGAWQELLSHAQGSPSMSSLGERLVAALRVIEDGSMSVGEPVHGLTSVAGPWSWREGGNYPALHTTASTPMLILEEASVSSLKQVWRDLSIKAVEQRLRLALSRFGLSTTRSTVEDALVDLVIAAEALFGTGATTEITHRVSLNAALFVESPELSRSEVRRFFREVYRMRSAIVHGDKIKPVQMNTRGAMTPDSVAKQLRALMKAALRKAISELHSGDRKLDWDAQLDSFLDGAPSTS